MIEQRASKNGNCYECGKAFGKTAMKNHILKEHNAGVETGFLIKIESTYSKDYWLFLDIPKSKKLDSLDRFLREIWLECCGHMSRFAASDKSHNDIGKTRTIDSFSAGDIIFYEYDMGTTTSLKITFIGDIKRPKQSTDVRLLSRNIAPELPCFICGKPAKHICAECMYDPDETVGALFCNKHAKEHEHDDMMMPVTNSPRSGECGYTGEFDIYTFNEKNIGKPFNPKGSKSKSKNSPHFKEALASEEASGTIVETVNILSELFSGNLSESDLTDDNLINMFGGMVDTLITPGKPVFTLREIYEAKSVSSLREICEMEELEGYAKLKKSELISLIIENHISSDEIKSMFLIMTDDEFQLFNDNLDTDSFVVDETIFQSILLISARLFVIFKSGSTYHCVIPKEIKAFYKTFAKERNLSEARGKMRNVRDHIKSAVNLYGVIEIADFAALYNNYNNTSIDSEMAESLIAGMGLSAENYGLMDSYLVHGSFFDSEEVESMVKHISDLQKNKPRYIPTHDEYLRYTDDDYYEETTETVAFRDNLIKNGFKNQGELSEAFTEMNWLTKIGVDEPLAFFQILHERGFHFKSQEAAKKSMDVAMAMYNSTRMWINNGFAPNEMSDI